jgi:transcription regulator MmyB-like protein
MRLTYHPAGLRNWIVNWEETASAYIQWLHRDLLRTGDPKTGELLNELLAYPGIPKKWLAPDLDASARLTTSRCTSCASSFSFPSRFPDPELVHRGEAVRVGGFVRVPFVEGHR